MAFPDQDWYSSTARDWGTVFVFSAGTFGAAIGVLGRGLRNWINRHVKITNTRFNAIEKDVKKLKEEVISIKTTGATVDRVSALEGFNQEQDLRLAALESVNDKIAEQAKRLEAHDRRIDDLRRTIDEWFRSTTELLVKIAKNGEGA